MEFGNWFNKQGKETTTPEVEEVSQETLSQAEDDGMIVKSLSDLRAAERSSEYVFGDVDYDIKQLGNIGWGGTDPDDE